MGGHNPIHDFLDASLRRVGGDRNAYKKYKKQQTREKEWRDTEHSDNGYIYDRRGAHRIDARISFNGGAGSGGYGSNGIGGFPLLQPAPPIQPRSPMGRRRKPRRGSPRVGRRSKAFSDHENMSRPILRTVSEESLSNQQTLSGGSETGTPPRASGFSKPVSPAKLLSIRDFERALRSERQRRGSRAAAIGPSQSEFHVRTSVAPIGDMTRTYVEGMVTPEEFEAMKVTSGDL